MKNIKISSVLHENGAQLLYVYDFLVMWRFLITLRETSEGIIKNPRCINKIGEIPETAPDIQFESNQVDHYHEVFEEWNEY